MKNTTCIECGQWNGHFQGCPEAPEPEESEHDLALQHATEIMEGFLCRFPAPECVEQAEVVSRANACLSNFASKAISQNNNQNTH